MKRVDLGLGGGTLLQLAKRGPLTMAYMIKTDTGKLIMIDSGYYCSGDGEAIYELIMQNGGHVDAWFMTHPHLDHIGAFGYMMEKYGDQIKIDKMYFNFPADAEWMGRINEENDNRSVEVMYRCIEKYNIDCVKAEKGLYVDLGVKFEILNDALRDYRKYQDTNDISICIKAYFKKRTVLFTGDLGVAPQYEALKDAGEKIKCDVVQMAHHGQNGVDIEFYREVGAKVCLWPTPDWLWNNDSSEGVNSGPWKTLLTREWMKQLGVTEHYVSADGDYLFE